MNWFSTRCRIESSSRRFGRRCYSAPAAPADTRLSKILTPGTDSHASVYRRTVRFTPRDLLNSKGIFRRHEPVLNSRMVHFTTNENRTLIEVEKRLRAENSSSDYDGVLQSNSVDERTPSAPRAAYFRLAPRSDKIHFPFSFSPSAVPAGSETSALSLDLTATVFNGSYKLYLCSLVPSQFGPPFTTVVHAHVAAVPRKHEEFADEHMIPMDMLRNELLRLDPGMGVPIMATAIDASALIHANASKKASHFEKLNDSGGEKGDVEMRGLQVTLVLLDDVDLSDKEASYEWQKSYRLKGGLINQLECPVPRCGRVLPGMYALKDHYRGAHTDSRLQCSFPLCSFTTKTSKYLRRHVRMKHQGEYLQCMDCSYTTSYRFAMTRHEATMHRGERVKCDECDRSYSSRSNLNAHRKKQHPRQQLAAA